MQSLNDPTYDLQVKGCFCHEWPQKNVHHYIDKHAISSVTKETSVTRERDREREKEEREREREKKQMKECHS